MNDDIFEFERGRSFPVSFLLRILARCMSASVVPNTPAAFRLPDGKSLRAKADRHSAKRLAVAVLPRLA
jgi:hypothetical protein